MGHGLRRGVLIDETWSDGGARTLSARLWPQTERLKAALVRWERAGGNTAPREAMAAFNGLWPYLTAAPPGLWREWRLENGEFKAGPSPASSLYHIICALAELIRVASLS
jgi:mannose-6-phosphate isomerase